MELKVSTKDYSVTKEDFDLYYDTDREMLITKPQPENLARYYQSDKYISHTDSRATLIDRLYQFVKRRNLKNKIQSIDKQGVKDKSLLDFGAGTGDFLKAAEARDYKVLGIEPNADARQKAENKGVTLVSNLEELKETGFGVITLWHVLEHLPNLDEQISAIRQLLDRDGLLVVAVPNHRSYDAAYYKEFWAAYDVPRHLWHFSRTSIEKIFAKHQMKVVGTKPMLYDAFYVSLLSEKYKGNRLYFFNAFWIGLWSNIKAIFTKEHSSIIYYLKNTN